MSETNAIGRERGIVLLPFPSNLSKHAISLMATVDTHEFSASTSLHQKLIHLSILPTHCFSHPSQKMWQISPLPFHSNPSCNLKNSRNAGSSFKLANSLGCAAPSSIPPPITDRRLSAAAADVDEDDEGVEFGVDLDDERQICARRPSNCRSPFFILMPSKEER